MPNSPVLLITLSSDSDPSSLQIPSFMWIFVGEIMNSLGGDSDSKAESTLLVSECRREQVVRVAKEVERNENSISTNR